MPQFKRRTFLGLSGAAVVALFVAPRASAAHVHVRLARQGVISSDVTEPLLGPAIAWVSQLRQSGVTELLYPVSRLQRQFLIGYDRTCRLADSLAERAEWTIDFSADGTRYARIHATEPV